MCETTKQTTTICVTFLICFGVFIGGTTSCSILASRELTDRVTAVCTGDLAQDVARAISCANLTNKGSM